MNEKIRKLFSPQTIICGIVIAFMGFMAFLFPYSGDDWAWGSEIGLERLEIFFDNYNGRYLGNFLVMAITRSEVLKVLFMALSYFLSCFICHKYSGSKKTVTLLFAVFTFFLMPRYTFAQSVVWASGYANYVPSALLSVGYLFLVKNITGEDKPQYHRHLVIATLLMGFAGAPFMENIALFNICLGIAVIGYTFIKFRKFYLAHIGFLVGAIAGALWMFSNTVYKSVASGEDAYRTAATGLESIVHQAIANAKIICYNLFTNNIGICIVATILLLLLGIGYVKKTPVIAKKVIVVLSLAANVLSLLPYVYRKSGMIFEFSRTHSLPYINYSVVKVFCMAVFALTTLVVVFICVSKKRRFSMLLPLLCIPVTVAPLLVVTPIGPRCFFIDHLLLMVFLVDLFSYVFEDMQLPAKRVAYGCLAATLLLQVCFYLSVFVPIYKCDVKRNELAKLQSLNNEKTIVVCDLPDEGYVWCSSLERAPWPWRYKLFHQLDGKIPVTVVSAEEFDKYYEEYINEHKQ